MIIAFVLDDTLDRPDGVQQYVLTIGKWLASRGHDVHYLVAATTRDDIPGIHGLGGFVTMKFNGNRVRTPVPVSYRRIKAALAAIRPDVLHVQMPYSPFFAARVIMAADKKTRIVGTFHILPVSRASAAANRPLAALLRRSQSRISRVVAVSPAAADFARRVYHLDPTVLPAPVDVTAASNPPPPARLASDPLRVVFLGRLVARKGVLQLIKAYSQLADTMPIQLIIGGTGPLLESARKLAARRSDISFAGFIDESDKRDFLASAHIAVFPSTGGESFGIILIEAMAAGAGIVLGGDNPGYESVLGTRSGALVDPRDIAAFTRALQRYISDPDARRKLHDSQQERVKRFDIARIGPEIQSLYEAAAQPYT
ncbi:MAG TPA: glycosyltransferase family 4 protein [Candidatus Saccharimonadia bacterium]|nr:glycosyltransferase family 4 protein [Candidatus Saccharimonadia bacterium]